MLCIFCGQEKKTQKNEKVPTTSDYWKKRKSVLVLVLVFGSVSRVLQYRPGAMMAVWFIDCIVLGRQESPGQPPFNSCHYYGSYYKFHRHRSMAPSVQTFSLHTAPFIHNRLFSSRRHVSFIMFILDQKMTLKFTSLIREVVKSCNRLKIRQVKDQDGLFLYVAFLISCHKFSKQDTKLNKKKLVAFLDVS